MSFEDLPNEWPTLSLANSAIAVDVVDLFLKTSDRVHNSALLLVCDGDGRAMQPVVINDIDWYATADDRTRLFDFLGHLPVPGVIMAVSARTPVEPEVAQRWLQTARAELHKYNIELLGFYSADQHAVRALPAAA